MKLVRQELLGTRVFVFTEKGRSTRILNLARGATVGDVVPLLNLSTTTHVPLVAGTAVALHTELKNGDIVSFAPVGVSLTAASKAIDTPLSMDGEVALPLAVQYSTGVDIEPAVWHVCERCLPLPCDDLVAVVESTSKNIQPATDGRVGGTLHRAACECLALRRQLAAGERSIRPTRGLSERYREQLGAAIGRTADESASEALFKTKVVVFTKDRPGMLLTVSTAVTANTVNIIDVHSKTREVGGESAFQYAVHISSLEQLDGLMIALDKLDDVVKVIRGDMEDMLHDSPAAFWENAQRES